MKKKIWSIESVGLCPTSGVWFQYMPYLSTSVDVVDALVLKKKNVWESLYGQCAVIQDVVLVYEAISTKSLSK